MNSSIFLYVGVIIAIAAILILCGIKMTKSQRIEKIKTVLLYFCLKAQKMLGEDAGKAKKSLVYGWLKESMPIVTIFLSEQAFSDILDLALVEMKTLLEKNPDLLDKVE